MSAANARGGGPWHILTGEYPPTPAGSPTTRGSWPPAWRRARGPRLAGGGRGDPPGRGGRPIACRRAGPGRACSPWAALDGCPPRRLVVQHTPTTGAAAARTSASAAGWLRRRRAGDVVWTMFHEAFYPFLRKDPPKYWLLAAAHRIMTRDLLRASERVYMSMPYWEPLLARTAVPRAADDLPAGAEQRAPVVDDPDGVAGVAARIGRGRAVVGNFGTFAGDLRDLLRRLLPPLLEGRDDRVGLLIGRAGDGFAAELAPRMPRPRRPAGRHGGAARRRRSPGISRRAT